MFIYIVKLFIRYFYNMILIHFLLIADDVIAPNEDKPKVPKTFGATDLTNGKAIWIKEAVPSSDCKSVCFLASVNLY